MKKLIIYTSIIIATVFFILLVQYGSKHSHGVPVEIKKAKTVLLEIPYLDSSVDLDKGIDLSFWDTRPATKVDFFYQIMVFPWPKATVPYVNIKTFHNKSDIYFYLEWPDDSEDSSLAIGAFTDSSAILFPIGEIKQTSSLMMGFLGKANIWHWKAIQNNEYWLNKKDETKVYVDFYYPFEEKELFPVSKDEAKSAVNDLMAIRVGTITPKPKQIVSGRGIYDKGLWKVVFKRTLKAEDETIDAKFSESKMLCAFAAWDGSKGDRGGRKSISDWVELKLK
tara:strand:- start:2219 stop:3058 length:840 start_codon:yes stop_codon:yes gene_type:complete